MSSMLLPNICLLHDDPVAMKHVLSYCYGYELGIDDMNLALEIYKLAHKYILDGLKKHCCKHIVDNMNKDNVKDVMESAQKYDFTDFMKNNCVPYVRELFTDFGDIGTPSALNKLEVIQHKSVPHDLNTWIMKSKYEGNLNKQFSQYLLRNGFSLPQNAAKRRSLYSRFIFQNLN